MKKTTLVIMAADLGNRHGGMKQIAPVDPQGHILMNYSIYRSGRETTDVLLKSLI